MDTPDGFDVTADAVEILSKARSDAFDALQIYEGARWGWVYRCDREPSGTLIDYLEAWRAVSNARDHLRRSEILGGGRCSAGVVGCKCAVSHGHATRPASDPRRHP